MNPAPSAGRTPELERLELRIGVKHLSERLAIEKQRARSETLGAWQVSPEFSDGVMRAIRRTLKLTGLWERGRRNTIEYRVTENKQQFPNLPSAFRGYRVLHLSDLHIEGIHDDCERLRRILSGIRADLCVLTGDFRFGMSGDARPAVERLEWLFRGLGYTDGMYAVPGNHDSHEIVLGLERIGVQVLMNEHVELERRGSRVALAGVDDPHYYRLHDIPKSIAGLEPERFKILLAHSPDAAEAAAQAGIAFYLCGHSHGGQICFPNGKPIVANLRCPRRFFSGAWREAGMQGYTSHGTGASGVPVRFFSRPEITIHELS